MELPNNWEPRKYQEPLWDYLSAGGTRAVARWHRRSGKDDVFLHHTACSAHERVGNYWYMLPEYSQARKSMWDAVNSHTGKRRIDEAFPVALRKSTREQEMMIQFHNGSTFQLVGSDNFNSLVGSPPVGLVFSEYALSNPSSWAYLRPILLENGGWAGFNSTPRGNNHFKNLCEHAARDKDWFYSINTADQTGVFTHAQLQSELIEMQAEHGDDFGKSLWLQEYHCSFDAAIMGSIWGDCVIKAELEGRIGMVSADSEFPFHTAWDLGYEDATACWFFQLIDGEIRIFDYHESNHKDIPYYAAMLREKSVEHGVQFGTHWLPHDARPRTLAAGGKSMLQQFQEFKVGRFAIAPRLDRQEGIQAGRATFPHVWMDKIRCERGIECLKQYHHEWDDSRKIYLQTPEHDWSSHGADAFRYMSLVWKHPKNKERVPTVFEGLIKGSIGNVTFGDLKDKHLKKMRQLRDLH